MANILGFLSKLRKVLGKIADIAIEGRKAGLWSEKDKVGKK